MVSAEVLFFFSGLIHANHGENITDYLLNQVKDATSDVSKQPKFEDYDDKSWIISLGLHKNMAR